MSITRHKKASPLLPWGFAEGPCCLRSPQRVCCTKYPLPAAQAAAVAAVAAATAAAATGGPVLRSAALERQLAARAAAAAAEALK